MPARLEMTGCLTCGSGGFRAGARSWPFDAPADVAARDLWRYTTSQPFLPMNVAGLPTPSPAGWAKPPSATDAGASFVQSHEKRCQTYRPGRTSSGWSRVCGTSRSKS